MGRQAGGAWVTHVVGIYEHHSVSADLWVGRFCLDGVLRAKKSHPDRVAEREAQESRSVHEVTRYRLHKRFRCRTSPVQPMEVIIRSASRAVKSTLAMLLIVKDRIAMRRAT